MNRTKKILNKMEKNNVEFVQLQFTNIEGKVKSMSVHASQIGEAIEEGVGFDGSSIVGYAEIEESDLVLIPDLETFKILPWKVQGKKVGRLFCNVCLTDGTPHKKDPRGLLERSLDTARRKGYEFYVGTEMEFYLFENDKEPTDDGEYLDYAPYDSEEELRMDLAMNLQDLGFIVEKIHHEVNPGQHELDFKYSDALTTADNVMACRQSLDALGREKDVIVDYTPKPLPEGMGSGLHCHHSLGDAQTAENLFYDPSGKFRMSDLARHFLAGELDHSLGLTALAASTPNSYKRLVPGYEAPVYVCWGGPNRSVMIRVPGYEIRSGEGMRFEYRTPDPMCNPYLLFTGILAAGIDGIERELSPSLPAEENVYEMSEKELEEEGILTLPGSLHEALDALENDKVLREALGEEMLNEYVSLKREEAING
ncbi:MAG: glutamine synthetase [Hadesarchaea archaeon]|nr:glutamine synthetase [Hadesarchaea archaeon]